MANEKVVQVLEAFKQLESFEHQLYIDRLKSHLSMNTSGVLTPAPVQLYSETPYGNALELMKIQTIVIGLSRTPAYGFHNTVNASNVEAKMDDAAAFVVHVLYRNWLEESVRRHSGGTLDLLALEADPEFCTAFADHVLDPAFINDTLIAIYARGVWAYPQAIAFVYERARKILSGTETHAHLGAVSAVTHWTPHAEKHELFMADPPAMQSFLSASLPVHWSDEKGLQGPSFPSLGKVLALHWRAMPDWAALVGQLVAVPTKLPDTYAPGMGKLPPHTIPGPVVYGDQLARWIRDRHSEYPDLFTGRNPNNSVHQNPSPLACFVPGTMVQTDQGEVAIETLEAGARVLTKAPGEYGTLSDEKVYNRTSAAGELSPKLMLYGFNDEQPFVTAGHIFFTTAGPKAIDPSIAQAENPSVVVNQLGIGDVLYRLDETRKAYTKVCITSFSVAPAPGEWVYGLHFRQGAHGGARYHANGYLVAANYPELTMKRFSDRLAALPRRQQKAVVESVTALPENLSLLLGPFLETFQGAVTRNRPSPLDKPEDVHRDMQQKISAKRVAAYTTSAEFSLFRQSEFYATHGASRISEVAIVEGAVMVNRELVRYANVSREHVEWSRQLPDKDGQWEHGSLKVSSDGFVVTGSIALQRGSVSSPEEAFREVDLASHDVVHVVGLRNVNTYKLQGSKKVFKDEMEAIGAKPTTDEPWNSFWTIETGLKKDAAGATVPAVVIPALDDEFGTGEDSIYEGNLVLDQSNMGRVDIVISSPADFRDYLDNWPEDKGPKPLGFQSIHLRINLVTDEVHGYYYELAPANADPSKGTPIHALYTPHAENHHRLKYAVTEAIDNSPFATMNLALTCDLYNPSANIHSPPAPLKRALALSASQTRSLTELQLLEAPDPSSLNALTQNYVMAAAGLWKGQKEREVFGDGSLANKDVVPSELKDKLSTKNKEFLETYSRALYLWSLAGSDNYSKHFTDEQRDRLAYWWKGKHKTSLAHSREFGNIMALAAGAAFKDSVSVDLQGYVDDDKNWAELFFKSITTENMLNNMVLSLIHGHNLVNKHCMVLNAIDKEHKRYDVKLWKLIRDKCTMMLGFEGRPVDDAEWPEFAVDFMEKLILKVQARDPSISEMVRKQLLLDIEELLREYNTRSAREAAEKTFSRNSERGRLIAEVVREIGGLTGKGGLSNMPLWVEKMKKKYDEKKQKYPRTFGSIMSVYGIVSQGYQLYKAIQFLHKWDNLSGMARAEAIIQVIESIFRMITDTADLLALFREHPLDTKEVRKICRRWTRRLGGTQPRVKVPKEGVEEIEMDILIDGKIARVNPEAAERPVEMQMGEVISDPAVEDKLMRRFKLGAKVGRVAIQAVVIAANVAVAASLGLQIAREWEYEQNVGILALDIITLSVTAVQTVIEVSELVLVVANIETVVIPIAGAVLAVIGVVLTIVAEIIESNRTPPPDGATKYIWEVAGEFTKGLPGTPKPMLSYEVTSSIPCKSDAATVEIKVTDKTNKGLKLKLLNIEFNVGDTAGDLFKQPTVEVETHKVTANPIARSVSPNKRFKLTGSDIPTRANNSLTWQVICTEEEVKALGETLTITITGVTNSAAGQANITISEVVENRGDDVPKTDPEQSFKVTKK